VKSLVWDGSGYWLLVKRLEHGRFAIFDRVGASRTSFEMSNTDLALLLDGVDLRGARRRASHDELNARVSR
jgi:transposase